MNSSASTSSWSHNSRARPNRTPSGPRPISTASSRSSIASSSSSLTRQPSIDTIREEVLTPHPMLRVPSPEHTTRRFSFVSSTSQFSTYSNAASLPSIESSGLNFDMLSERFDELMRRLECAPEPSQAGVVSRATTSSSKTLSAEKRPATGLVSPVRTRVVSQEAAGTRTPRPSSANKHRRTSSMSTTSTLGPETNSEHFTVSAFPQPPTSVPQRPSVTLSPTAPLKARYSLKPSPMSETMNGPPKHASWTGTLLYIDSTKVTDIKELQPDLEAQHQLEKAEPLTGLVGLRQRRPVLFGCGVYFLPILILAIIALIIFLVARYR